MTPTSKFHTAKGWLVGSALTLLAAAPALAQETAKKDKSALDSYLLDGGPLTIFIVAVGLLSLISLTVFNFMNLTRAKFAPDDLKGALLEHMTSCRVRSAIELSASHPQLPRSHDGILPSQHRRDPSRGSRPRPRGRRYR